MNILALCGIVLALACGASADEHVDIPWDGSIPIPQGGKGIEIPLKPFGVPVNALVTSVWAFVTVEKANDTDGFWSGDYDVYVGNSARGAWYHCIWEHKDYGPSSAIWLNILMPTEFDNDLVDQTWYVAVMDRATHGAQQGLGNVASGCLTVFYHMPGVPLPDLYDAGQEYASVSPTAGHFGEFINLSGRIRNGGLAPADNVYVEFYLSKDATITRDDFWLDDGWVSIVPGQSVQVNLAFHVGLGCADHITSPGTYYLGWIIDPLDYIAESNEDNNNEGYTSNCKLIVLASDQAAVPNVVGMTQADAESAIGSASLRVGPVWPVFSDTVLPGQVISQAPASETVLSIGEEVTLTVSKGPEPTTVPNVVGMTQADAESAITSARLRVGTIWVGFNDTVPQGQVISQEPVGETVVNGGTKVELTLSDGPEHPGLATVPHVVGMSQAQASTAIAAAGLVVGTVTRRQNATVPQGQVIGQNPAGGTHGDPGSAVNLTVSNGNTPVEGAADGPVAHWKLDETGGTTALDGAGAHNGTLLGDPVWLPTGGMFGGALRFDGIDDRVNCGSFDPSAQTNKLSVCLWARWNGQPVFWQSLIARRENGGEYNTMWSLEADIDTGKLGFFHETSVRFGGDPVLPIGEWAHVAVSVNGVRGSLYLNGEPTGAGPFTLPSGTQATVWLGASVPDGVNSFNGALDDIQLYDHPLSKTQIQTVMTGVEVHVGPNDVDLLAHWTFDETTGHVTHDPVSACHGVLMGGPLWQPAGEKIARGKIGGALKFDGVDDYVAATVVLDPADGPFSVFAWVRGGGAGQVILSQDGSAGGVNWLAASSIGRLTTQLGGNRILSSREAITDGQWHEVGVTWDGASRTLYVDGTAVATDNPAGPTSSTGGLNIGAGKNLSPGTFWAGLIDEVRIYSGIMKPQRSAPER